MNTMENGCGYFKTTDAAPEHFGNDKTSKIEFRLHETPLERHFANILKNVMDDQTLCVNLRTWITKVTPLKNKGGFLFKGNLRPPSKSE